MSIQEIVKTDTGTEDALPPPIPICCGVISLAAIIVISISFADSKLIPIPLSYQLLMIFILFAMIVAIIWNYTCTHQYSLCVFGIGWEKVPSWSIFALLLSTFFGILFFLGATSYSSDINYPLSIMITYAILFCICLIIGLVGVYDFRDNCGAATLHAGGNLLNFVIHSADIVTDIIAAINVFQAADLKFFMISIVFSVVTFFLYYIASWIIICSEPWEKIKANNCTKFLLIIPVLNILPLIEAMPICGIIGVVFSSFPQYIITLSFALEHNQLELSNYIALGFSLFSLCSSPFTTITKSVFNEKGKDDMKEQILHGFGLLVLYVIFVVPIILLEITHFFPILFEYYWYKNIDFNVLIRCLLCFNIPKILFAFLQVPGHDADTSYHKNMFVTSICGDYNNINLAEYIFGGILFLICFLTLPLIPVAILLFICLTEDGVDLFVWNLVITVLYLVIAYGGMSLLLFKETNDNMGDITFDMLIVTWVLSAWFPITSCCYYLVYGFFRAIDIE